MKDSPGAPQRCPSDRECGLTASEIAEVFIQVLGGVNVAEDIVGRLLFDCRAGDRSYWAEVIAAMRSLKFHLEMPADATLH